MAKKKEVAIVVKVMRTGSRVYEVALNGGRSINDALEAAEFTIKPSEEVYVNDDKIGSSEYDENILNDGDKIVLIKNIQGGLFNL